MAIDFRCIFTYRVSVYELNHIVSKSYLCDQLTPTNKIKYPCCLQLNPIHFPSLLQNKGIVQQHNKLYSSLSRYLFSFITIHLILLLDFTPTNYSFALIIEIHRVSCLQGYKLNDTNLRMSHSKRECSPTMKISMLIISLHTF